MKYNIDDRVSCTESGLEGNVLDMEWEGGWQYTILTDDKKYFYRNSREIDLVITK